LRASARVALCTAILGALAIGSAPAPSVARAADAPATAPTVAAPSLDAGLVELIDAALADPALAEATVGVATIDLETGKVLYQRGEDIALNPASNIKLVTTSAALGMLGPAHRYATRVLRADGSLVGDTVRGDVWISGTGDPDLVTADLYEVASELHAQGIRRISGGIVVDSSRFDTDGLPPGYDQKDEMASYRAPSGATSVNFNSFVIRVRPADAAGSTPFVGLDPDTAGIEITNEATTVAGARRQLWAAVEHEKAGTKVIVRGKIGIDAGDETLRYPVADPSVHAGRVFAHVLKQAGIKVGRKKIGAGAPPEDARLLAVHYSAPLSVLIRGVNKFSNNFMAEQILKTLAPREAPATFSAARERVLQFVKKRGVDVTGMVYGNGSGLYDTNRITAAQLAKLLAAVDGDDRIRPDFLASLSIMGVDGTTRRRNREGSAAQWVRAKTGTLDGVSALSGYVSGRGRRPIAFSILINGVPDGKTAAARAAQDRITELLARHVAGEPLITDEERAAMIPAG
jgi:serine-type D-Ala-D-Ala carboxypeptidase/endopeptidase (penicillin-binding protein 4)